MKSTIGERIRILRVIKSLSQENMANELDISVASYSNIERDVTELTVSRLLKIAKILGVKPSDILEYDNPSIIAESEQNPLKSSDKIKLSIEELKSQIAKINADLEKMKPSKPSPKEKKKLRK